MVSRRRRVLRLVLIGSVVAGLIAVVMVRGGGLRGPRVGIVDINGTIDDTTELLERLARDRTSADVVAVVLRIDSPGGSVASAQETYDAVRKLAAEKPVVASFGNTAASAAYYIGAGATTIVASPGTLTGSIGAIMEFPYVAPLAEKVGVDAVVVKSGRFKDIGSPLRRLAAEERQLLQNMVDDVLRQFVEAVAEGRRMPVERVQALADGRVFSGAQAQALGLVDQLGGLELATRLAWEAAGQTGEPQVERPRHRRWPWWLEMLDLDGRAAVPRLGSGLFLLYQGGLPR